MNVLTWIIGLAIAAWVGAMSLGALFKTKGAKAWFGDKLEQSPALMTINGLGLLVTVVLILLNLFLPAQISAVFVKWALIGIVVSQLSTLFMLIRNAAPKAANVGPIVLIVLAILYWFLRT